MRVKEGNKEKDILEAAVKVFSKEGFHRSRISKIAEVAGVATGSVYVYFKNKESILLTIFEQLWEKLYIELRILADKADKSPTEQIDSIIDLVFDVFTENPALADVFVNEQNQIQKANKNEFTDYYAKFLDLGEEIIRTGINKKIISNKVDAKIFRFYILGAIRNLLQGWSHDPKTFPLKKIRENVKYLINHGIRD